MKEKFKKNFNSETLLYILTVFAVILLFGFFWTSLSILSNEALAFRDDSIAFNNIFEIFRFPIALLIALLAVITLHITIQRLIQTAKQLDLISIQIKTSRQPEIFIDNINIPVFTYTDGEYGNKITITHNRLMNVNPYFLIYNIGIGSAVEIKLNFDFDFEAALNLIISLNESVKWFEISEIDEDLKIIKAIKSEFVIFMGKEGFDKPHDINFVTSYSQGSQNNQIKFPNLFLDLFLDYMSLVHRDVAELKVADKADEEERIQKFPKLFLNIDYNDIGGIENRKKFQVTPIYDQFSNPFFEGNFRITENNFEIKVSPHKE